MPKPGREAPSVAEKTLYKAQDENEPLKKTLPDDDFLTAYNKLKGYVLLLLQEDASQGLPRPVQELLGQLRSADLKLAIVQVKRGDGLTNWNTLPDVGLITKMKLVTAAEPLVLVDKTKNPVAFTLCEKPAGRASTVDDYLKFLSENTSGDLKKKVEEIIKKLAAADKATELVKSKSESRGVQDGLTSALLAGSAGALVIVDPQVDV